MFNSEGEMYSYVKHFFIKKKNCASEKTHYTYHENGATDGKKLTLLLYGREIEPDVYGINEKEDVVYLAEGKLDYQGKALDEAIVQGVSYQRFAQYVYIFFPKSIFEGKPKIKKHIEELCRENNLGLLLVSDTGKVSEDLQPKLSKFYGREEVWREIRKNVNSAKEEMMRLLLTGGEERVGKVHLPILRDICYLLGERKEWVDEEFTEYLHNQHKLLKKYKLNGSQSSLAPHDWTYTNPLLKGLKGERGQSSEPASDEYIFNKFRETIEETIKTLIYLNLCEKEENKIRLTPHGVNFKKVIDESGRDRLYTKNIEGVIRIFIAVLLAKEEMKDYILKMCKIIKGTQPQPRDRLWCNKCSFNNNIWKVKKNEIDKIRRYFETKGKIICPQCENENVPQPYENLLLSFRGLDENYRIHILLIETKIIENKVFSQLPRRFQEKLKKEFEKPEERAKYWYLGENAPLFT